MPIRRGLLRDGFGFHFMGVPTEHGFLFIQMGFRSRANTRPARDPAGTPGNARAAKLRRLSPVLLRALLAAAQQARRRQAQVRREELIEELCSTFMDGAAVAQWLERYFSLADADQGSLRWSLS